MGVIALMVVLTALIVVPKQATLDLRSLGLNIFDQFSFKEGLDLQGGTHLVYQADFSQLAKEKNGGKAYSSSDEDSAMKSLVNVIERRVNAFGVSEPLVQTANVAGQRQLIVDLAGVKNVDQAQNLIGKTADLEFETQSTTSSTGFIPAGLTGKDFTRASVSFDQSNNPQISIDFNSAGAKLFSQLTGANIGKPIGIFLDGSEVSAPTVQQQISNGQAVITGTFTLQQAQQLAIQLNAGALPVPINLIEQQTVGATLGKQSVRESIAAGILGLAIVALFMILYYRLPGLVATLALGVYSLLVMAIFKGGLFFIGLPPVTMTLAGVAGFILSIGMAVDANILTFERMKEELRAGKPMPIAIENGFKRAWTSIRDSNVATLITSGILYYFGTGIIRGFALTLAIGVLVSMFTAVFVTRTFMRIVVRSRLAKRRGWFGFGIGDGTREVKS
jgi:preprotein translocase subunit SecD